MRSLNGLPMTARIEIKGWRNLWVEDQRVCNYDGLLFWLIDTIGHNHWDVALSELISQGFRFEAVIEECIEDLRDPEKCKKIIWWINDNRGMIDYSRYEFESRLTVKIVVKYLAEKLSGCKNWAQLYGIFSHKGRFRKNISRQEKW